MDNHSRLYFEEVFRKMFKMRKLNSFQSGNQGAKTKSLVNQVTSSTSHPLRYSLVR